MFKGVRRNPEITEEIFNGKKVMKRALKNDSFLEISCVMPHKKQPSGSIIKLYCSKIFWQFQEED